jgi:hypothetical protein
MSRYAVATCAAVLVTTIALVSAQNPPPQTTPQAGAAATGGRQGGRGPQQPPRMPPPEFFSKNTPKDLVEFELMTWPEVYRAIHEQGKTVALIYFGGTESRGPQNVNGGHTLMGRANRQTDRAQTGQCDRAAGHPVLAEHRQRADDGHAGTDVRDSGGALRADRGTGDRDGLHNGRHP